MNLPSEFENYTRNLLGDALYSRLREGLAEAPSPTSIRLNPFKAASREVNGQLMESVVPWCPATGRYLNERPNFTFDPFSRISHRFTTAFGGFLGTIIILASLVFLFMPLIIVLLIIRYFVRRHKDRVRLAEMAMEKGVPLPEEQAPLLNSRAEYMWRRGVRNTSTGVGLMIFFWCLGANPLVGIGGLVACIGLGQMFMVKYNYDSKLTWKRKNEETYEEPLYSDIADTTENNEENGEERNNPNETNR